MESPPVVKPPALDIVALQDISATLAQYDAPAAASYDGQVIGRHVDDQQIGEFISLHDGPVKMVLDVGCGTGDLALAIARKPFSSHNEKGETIQTHACVLGVDLSLYMIKQAQQKAQALIDSNRVKLVRCNAFVAKELGVACNLARMSGLPIPNPPLFDIITCIWVAKDTQDRTLTEGLRHWTSLLAPNGRIILQHQGENRLGTLTRYIRQPNAPPVLCAPLRVGTEECWDYCKACVALILPETSLALLATHIPRSQKDWDEDVSQMLVNDAKAQWQRMSPAQQVMHSNQFYYFLETQKSAWYRTSWGLGRWQGNKLIVATIRAAAVLVILAQKPFDK